MNYELPSLPYEMNALEPHISAETLEYHYGKHHRKYVNTLNDLIAGSEFEDMPLESIIQKANGPIFNNAAQVWNHAFYWNCLSPKGGGEPVGKLAEAIENSYRSFHQFKEEFTKQATALFGAGWVWLVKGMDETVAIEQTKDGDNPLTRGRIALLTCDMWEHAYYIDYRNDKGRYLDAFWNLVNWDFAASNFDRG
jgi:superoxide dismutase, Fe-Mn family